MINYVVTSKRLRNYLYALGFNYKQVEDISNKQEYVWLFKNNDFLQEAIEYYTKNKKRMIEMNKKEISSEQSIAK
jgi:hypothetical protein